MQTFSKNEFDRLGFLCIHLINSNISKSKQFIASTDYMETLIVGWRQGLKRLFNISNDIMVNKLELFTFKKSNFFPKGLFVEFLFWWRFLLCAHLDKSKSGSAYTEKNIYKMKKTKLLCQDFPSKDDFIMKGYTFFGMPIWVKNMKNF